MAWLCCACLGTAHAAALNDADAVPQLPKRGADDYREFLDSDTHRAFVIAPGGSWAWRAGLPSAELAEQAALEDCRANTQQTCVPYAIDEQVVFDARGWPKLWGPYTERKAAAVAKIGMKRGERFPDLALRDPAGKPLKLSDFRGKVLVVHFWGSWCGPCRKELPELQALVNAMKTESGVRFLFLPLRESIAASRNWLKQQNIDLPLYDSSSSDNSNVITLANGEVIPDRQLASMFPTTYVLDRHGLVLFSHRGAASRWLEYIPFLKDAATRSGR